MAEAQQVAVSGGNVPPAQSQPGHNQAQVPHGDGQEQQFSEPPARKQLSAPAKPADEPAQSQQQTPSYIAPQDPDAYDLKSGASSDPMLGTYMNVFGAIGKDVDLERAIGKALQYGNPALIDAAYLHEKGGAHFEQLQTLAKAMVERVQAQSQEITESVYKTAGSKAEWDAAAAMFDTSAPQHVKVLVKQMLDSGNRESIQHGAQLVLDYTKQGGFVPTRGEQVRPSQAAGLVSQGLSKAEYQQLHFKLDSNSKTYLQDRAALQDRRALGKRQGI
jgi:hypothetical protein